MVTLAGKRACIRDQENVMKCAVIVDMRCACIVVFQIFASFLHLFFPATPSIIDCGWLCVCNYGPIVDSAAGSLRIDKADARCSFARIIRDWQLISAVVV